MFKPQNEFPLLTEYKKCFEVTDNTIFAYNNVIYTNNKLTDDLVVHEKVHLRRQNKLGVDKWVYQYLSDVDFRLKEEVLAYKEQLLSVKDREERHFLRILCARDLSSKLYGSIISYEEAFDRIK